MIYRASLGASTYGSDGTEDVGGKGGGGAGRIKDEKMDVDGVDRILCDGRQWNADGGVEVRYMDKLPVLGASQRRFHGTIPNSGVQLELLSRIVSPCYLTCSASTYLLHASANWL